MTINGGVDEAIKSYRGAIGWAEKAGDAAAVTVYERMIEAAEKLRPAEVAL